MSQKPNNTNLSYSFGFLLKLIKGEKGLQMPQNWTTLIIAAVAVSLAGLLLWKKKKHSFVKVGKISKLYFFPVKSLRGMEVTHGKCTKIGFEVNGLLDRSFMLVDSKGVLISQREAPNLALLTLKIDGRNLIVTSPSGKILKIEIRESVASSDSIIECWIHTERIEGVDCGEEAAAFFRSHTNLPDICLVRYFPSLPKREFVKNKEFFRKLRNENPVGFPDLAPFHIMSQPTIDDLNSKLEDQKVSVLNFRPNILVEGCKPYEEDAWRYIKFRSGALMCNLILVTRCILTTNDPFTGILTKKEPLVTLRKYRIPKDPEMLEKTGSIPCLGIACGVRQTGDLSVGDDIFAVIVPQPKMNVK
ncbi:mitochondrial amidoxime-reducing component 1 [Nephila pilipes]|uniref:Mitochondrial amidoxime-reducing component 1 n=1 Tax=Nephila pilipes TaxID=299642 RepID=A0A8X6SYM3_NEPPI|nr:mitochondrial amidoxime-reducing component 1 [Nephila pilipes]